MILTQEELTQIRQECATKVAVNYTKPQINAAAQAVEDWFEANRSAISTAINTATAPLVFTAAQKKVIVVHWLISKFNREKQ